MKPVARNLPRFFLLICGAVFITVFSAPPAAALVPPRLSVLIGAEPDARIGILMKVSTAELTFAAPYRAFRMADHKPLWAGKAGTLLISLISVGIQDSPPRYRVVAGSFKSFEQADYTSEKLTKFKYPFRIANPNTWVIWVGPFEDGDQAKSAETRLRTSGFTDARAEMIPEDRAASLQVTGNDGTLLYMGSDAVLLEPSNGYFFVQDRKYRGRAELITDAYGTFTVVNRVPVDDYLLSVLPGEMPHSAAPEALKAQAVIARSYYLNNRGRHQVDNFELCGTTDCQVYIGMRAEMPETTAAVRATRGEVMAWRDRLANTLFHSTCGGRTAGYDDNWGGVAPPYLASVSDAPADSGDLSTDAAIEDFLNGTSVYCATSKYFRWEVTRSRPEMTAVLQENLPTFTNRPDLVVGNAEDIQVLQRSKSGRALRIRISTDSGDFDFERDSIRWVLGKLKSTLFVVKRETGADGAPVFRFRGAGWGHGVGLCQIGAMQRAARGESYKAILGHYYPGTRLRKLWK